MPASAFEVRRLTSGDGELLASALRRLADEIELPAVASAGWLARALRRPGTYFFVAYAGAGPVGYLGGFAFPSVEEDADQAYLFDLAVAAEHRRRGIGRTLVEEFLGCCRADGVACAWVGTERDNLPARRAFEAAGARLAGERYAEYAFML